MAASTETKSKTNKNGKSAPAERLEHKKGKDNEQTTGTTVVQPNDDLARLPADALVPPFAGRRARAAPDRAPDDAVRHAPPPRSW